MRPGRQVFLSWLEQSQPAPDKQVKRKFRLTRTTDYKRVRRFGKSHAHPLLVLVALPNENGSKHFAVSAGRSVGNAVQRNHAKRLLREALRPELLDLQPGWDVILIARQPLSTASFAETREALLQLLRRARLIRNINVS